MTLLKKIEYLSLTISAVREARIRTEAEEGRESVLGLFDAPAVEGNFKRIFIIGIEGFEVTTVPVTLRS